MSDLLLIGLGLTALFFGGNGLVTGAARLASSFGISAMVIALTVVAFGTSVPELLVSVNAAQQGSSGIALGNVVGSNIANIGLILGLAALITPVVVEWRMLRREIPLLVLISLVVLVMALDGQLTTTDGILLLVGFVAFTAYAYILAWRERRQMETEIREFTELEGITPPEKVRRWLELARLAAGIVLLALGANWTVDGASSIARQLGISDLIIGLTVVAFGTSLPELASSIVAAMRKENDIIVGNIIGSNIANLLVILGVTALVQAVPVDQNVMQVQFPIMIGFSLLLLLFLVDRVIKRHEGILLVVAYLAYVVFVLA
jgi:cation:H+ antiporter